MRIRALSYGNLSSKTTRFAEEQCFQRHYLPLPLARLTGSCVFRRAHRWDLPDACGVLQLEWCVYLSLFQNFQHLVGCQTSASVIRFSRKIADWRTLDYAHRRFFVINFTPRISNFFRQIALSLNLTIREILSRWCWNWFSRGVTTILTDFRPTDGIFRRRDNLLNQWNCTRLTIHSSDLFVLRFRFFLPLVLGLKKLKIRILNRITR